MKTGNLQPLIKTEPGQTKPKLAHRRGNHRPRNWDQYHHFPLENKRLEGKINQNIVTLNRNTHLKENKVGHQMLKDQMLDKNPSKKPNTIKWY